MAALAEFGHLTHRILLVFLLASSVISQDNTTTFGSSLCYQGNCDVDVGDIQEVINQLQLTNQRLRDSAEQLLQAIIQQDQTINTLTGTATTCCNMTAPPTTLSTGQPIAGCPAGFQYLPEANGCYQIVLQALNWTQSQAICSELDPRAHLAVITSEQQSIAIANYTMTFDSIATVPCIGFGIPPGPAFYTSGQRIIANDCSTTFVWKPSPNTNIPLTYTDWANGEPNCDSGSEGCIEYWANENNQWNDVDCSRAHCPICQLNAETI